MNPTGRSAPVKVFSIEEAVAKVREKYPTARAEGSTIDWSFWVGDEVVAEMKANWRSRKTEWELVIFDTPRQT